MDSSQFKEIIFYLKFYKDFISCICFTALCLILIQIIFMIIDLLKKRRLAKLTRKNLDKFNENNGTNQDNVND